MPDNDWWRNNRERAGDFDRGSERELRYGGYGRSSRSSDRGYDFDRGGYGRAREYGGSYGAQAYGRSYPDYARWEEARGFGGSSSRGGFYGAGEGYGRRGGFSGDRGEPRPAEREDDALAASSGPRRRQDLFQAGQAVSFRGRGPKGYQRSDDRIREDVSDRLTDDPHVDASDIEIGVSAGEVTLTGTVNSRFERRRAEDIAETVSGVKYIQNNLRVSQQGAGGAWASTSEVLGTAARRDLVRTKGAPDDFVTGDTTPDAAQRDKGDVPGPGLGSV